VLGVVLALGCSVVWGCADFFGGLQARRLPVLVVLLWGQLAAVVLAIALVLLVSDGTPTLEAFAWAAGSGAAGIAALLAFYRGLAIGTMSIVAPVSATGAAVPVLVGLARGEHPGALQVAGIALAFAGIVLAAREDSGGAATRARAALGLAIVAALGFGAWFAGIDRATELAGVTWTVLLTRAVQAVLLLAGALVLRPGGVGGDTFLRGVAPLLAIGALDVLANGLYALATQHGLLSVVAVLGSLYPAMTVVLARTVLHERVTRSQEVGIVAILAGVAAISAG
jgi:drug/metabolite transporter (DMT)-like permease